MLARNTSAKAEPAPTASTAHQRVRRATAVVPRHAATNPPPITRPMISEGRTHSPGERSAPNVQFGEAAASQKSSAADADRIRPTTAARRAGPTAAQWPAAEAERIDDGVTVRAGVLTLLVVVLLGAASGCDTACAGALMEGVLTERNGDLVVAHEDGFVEPVNWSASHHSVRDDGGELVVVDWLGIVKAREGDFVSLGGGETEEVGVWNICGRFEVGEGAAI